MAEASVLAVPGVDLTNKSLKAIWAASIGNLLEWYDFGVYGYLDLVPKGRDEDGLPFTMAWVRHHDRYEK